MNFILFIINNFARTVERKKLFVVLKVIANVLQIAKGFQTY